MSPESLIGAVSVLALAIFVHEMGHFLAGKWCDVEVRTFSMGFGPTLFARRVGETVYRIALIPFGGYVRMAGYDEEGSDPEDAPADPRRGFGAKRLWQRATIIAAGPAVNLVCAALVLSATSWFYGISRPADVARVGALVPGMPAETAGVRAGDTVVAIDGKPIELWTDLHAAVTASDGKALVFDLRSQDGERREVEVAPVLRDRHDAFGEKVASAYQIGVAVDEELRPVGVVEAVGDGVAQTWFHSTMILQTVGRLLQGRVSPSDLGGPILIVREAGRQAESGLRPLLFFFALISINLGVLNLLPIPVLDGGHLAFMAFELVRGRPLSLRVREHALQAGVLLIGGLMIFVVFNDIVRITAG